MSAGPLHSTSSARWSTVRRLCCLRQSYLLRGEKIEGGRILIKFAWIHLSAARDGGLFYCGTLDDKMIQGTSHD